ncbi:MAG: ABC transporter permease subunit [Pseudomonadales bacterium]|nr:ABC transporter permease subunit [Pseudomonadales bacterium]
MKRLVVTVALFGWLPLFAGEPIVVASKNFTESYLLGEVIAQRLEQAGMEVDRRFGLGGTLICFEALLAGEIDVYVEYSGTLEQTILKLGQRTSILGLNEHLLSRGLSLLSPLGFNNTYAIAVRKEVAEEFSLERISQLTDYRDLRVVVSHEFLEREDGWPGMRRVYGFDWIPEGIEHGLAYQAMADGSIDITDAYSTDGELQRYDLTVLADDKAFFPTYLAIPLIRDDLSPRAQAAIEDLAGTLDDSSMASLNASVVFEGEDFASAARNHLRSIGFDVADGGSNTFDDLIRNTQRHLWLTAIALLTATVVGIVLALAVFQVAWISNAVLYVAGLLQTIPSIALLALMIPIFGIGMLPAVMALFLYSLLPIVRNSVTALATVDPVLRRVGKAMGLTRYDEIRYVYVPLAMPAILAGVRTAAVISIGTATLAAFIGAGGLGDPIVTGLALNDTSLILQGAIPAAVLAIATELMFEGIERVLVPRHLKVLEQPR